MLSPEDKALIQSLTKYLFPDTSRGPAHREWTNGMQKLAILLDWKHCEICKGTGMEWIDTCFNCRGVGKVEL